MGLSGSGGRGKYQSEYGQTVEVEDQREYNPAWPWKTKGCPIANSDFWNDDGKCWSGNRIDENLIARIDDPDPRDAEIAGPRNDVRAAERAADRAIADLAEAHAELAALRAQQEGKGGVNRHIRVCRY